MLPCSSVRRAPLFVVPIDFSRDTEAIVSTAFALAKECGTRVHLLEVVAARKPAVLVDRGETRFGERIAPVGDWPRLERAMDAAERQGIDVSAVSYRGDTAAVIPAYLELTNARLLIVGRDYGTSSWRRSTGIVSTLSRTAPAPLLILPPQSSPAKRRSLSFRHLVSAVDFTVASAVAVRTVSDLMRRTGARLTLVHALDSAERQMVFSGSEAATLSRHTRDRATQAAARLRNKVPADVRVRVNVRVTTGAPHRAILDVALDVRADLIALGVPPRTRLNQVLLGSTLRHVLRGAHIPLLVIPVPAGAYAWLERTETRARSATPSRRLR